MLNRHHGHPVQNIIAHAGKSTRSAAHAFSTPQLGRHYVTASKLRPAAAISIGCLQPNRRSRYLTRQHIHKSPWLRAPYPPTRYYATKSSSEPRKEIAVLGGGITGLATTYYLQKEFPNAKITLFESKQELGGWIKSKSVDVGDGEVIFESGPRSLRPAAPNGTLTLRMLQDLGLVDDVLATMKDAPAAQNRFIYYPDHLVRMPGPGQSMGDILGTVWSEPVFKGIVRAVWNDINASTRSDDLSDESIGHFISRRADERLANNLASALFHGIYAGDIWQLSAKSILALPWRRELKHGNFIGAGMTAAFEKSAWSFCDDAELQAELQTTDWNPMLRNQIMNCSVFTFKRGVGQLAEALEQRLKQLNNVEIMTGTQLTVLEKDQKSANVKISYKQSSNQNTTDSTTSIFNNVVSTISPKAFISLLPDKLRAPSNLSTSPSLARHLDSVPAVTVCVVNLYFRTPYLLLGVSPPGGLPQSLINSGTGLQGFGYLIPNSVPFSQNPERALGVIFDSDIAPNLHTTVPRDKLGTRLTVMLGGHWWDGWKAYPSDTEAQEMALSVLERHLGITQPPTAVNVTLQQNCIPQYVVGHEHNMALAHEALLDAFSGRLRVAGSWYTGVGVNDCLRAAYDVVQGLGPKATLRKGNPNREQRTGLERFAWGRPMVLIKREKPGEMTVVRVEELGRKMGYFEGVGVEGETSWRTEDDGRGGGDGDRR